MTNTNRWIYLSPHLDDVVYSSGGRVWEHVRLGDVVEIWTIFAGDAPGSPLTPFAQSLHTRWGTGIESTGRRREEDMHACDILGAVCRHLPYPDCIYRVAGSGLPVIRAEEDLFQAGYVGEENLANELAKILQESLPDDANLAVSYGIGNHIDHQLLGRAARKLNRRLWFYPDYPYAAGESVEKWRWNSQPGMSSLVPVSSRGLSVWQSAAAAYESQISTFWSGLNQLQSEIGSYWCRGYGSLLRSV